jgi:hypothetical protein
VLVVGGLDEFVDQRGGGDVADLEPGFGRGVAQPDQQVTLAGAGIPDQADWLPGPDPRARGWWLSPGSAATRRRWSPATCCRWTAAT